MKRRALVWVGWPLMVVIFGLILPDIARFWLGYGFDLSLDGPSAGQIVQFVWMVLLPPLIFEIVVRIRRNGN